MDIIKEQIKQIESLEAGWYNNPIWGWGDEMIMLESKKIDGATIELTKELFIGLDMPDELILTPLVLSPCANGWISFGWHNSIIDITGLIEGSHKAMQLEWKFLDDKNVKHNLFMKDVNKFKLLSWFNRIFKY